VHRARAVTRGAGFGLGAWLGTGAAAGAALFPRGDANLGVFAGRRLFERDLHGIRQIAATVDLRAAAATTAASRAEQVAKDIAKGIGKAAITFGASATAAHVGVDARMTKLVIGGTLFRVREHFVGLFGLLELLFGFLGLVTLITVRVVLHGQLAVGLLDVVVRGAFGNAQHVVEITFCHGGVQIRQRHRA